MVRALSAFGLLRLLTVFAFAMIATHALAQSKVDLGEVPDHGEGWTLLAEHPRTESLTQPWVRPLKGQALQLDLAALKAILKAAPLEGTPRAKSDPLILTLPTPTGTWQRFKVVESPLLEPALQARHAEIRTYLGQGIDDKWATLRFEITPKGFTAQVLSPDGQWFIDPYTFNNTELYTAYNKADASKLRIAFSCGVLPDANAQPQMRFRPRGSVGTIRRQYRIAISTTGEFTEWAGGPTEAFAVVATSVSRLTQIYEQEIAVRFVLAANADQIIYPDPASDPFSNPANGVLTFSENQTSIDTVIGSDNYDIGHVFHKSPPGGSNGVASLSSVCTAGKARGYTSYEDPSLVFFVVDYVAHEVGHQFGARHPHANCGGAPGDAPSVLVEPGSGSTIMGYAGICGPTNLQPHSDPMFNAINFDQMLAFITGIGGCATTSTTGNSAPIVNAGPVYTIPAKTPFALTATGSDPDGDPLTYCWETRDAGPGIDLPLDENDNGTSSIVRSRPPVTSPTRTVPPIANILDDTFPIGECTPQVERSMKWRVTARDNRAGGAGVNAADTSITVVDTGAPFRITSFNTTTTLSSTAIVTWDVAGTAASPISCANVRISLSVDGGLTFPTVLAASVPNSGTATVSLPNVSTATARFKVEAVGNIFFDINDANLTINPGGPVAVFAQSGSASIIDTTGNGNSSGAIDPGEGTIQLFVPVQNIGAINANDVVGLLTSNTPTVTIGTSTANFPSIPVNQTRTNITPFVFAVSPDHPCGAPIALTLSVTSDRGANSFSIQLTTGSTSGGSPLTVSYTGNPVQITDGSAAGVNIPLNVSNIGLLADVNFRFDGTTCSTQINAQGVGLSHSWVGDLVIKLTSPAGTTVTIMNRPGRTPADPSGSEGNNFCNTILDDDGSFPLIQAIALDGTGAPYTGTFRPANPLSAFDGENGNGTWILNVADIINGDGGAVRRFSLVLTPGSAICSSPTSVTGACCEASGSCVVATPGFCPAGANYLGNSTSCSPNPCPQPSGACCSSSGSCGVATAADCAAAGSTYQGDLTTCSPSPCPQPSGACCAVGVCFIAPSDVCAGVGTFQGAGSTCAPNPCPQPTGACCDSVGVCTTVTQDLCTGSSIWNLNVACDPNPCAAPSGTCCTLLGQCIITLQAGCITGTWTLGASCTPVNPCPQPAGSCCSAGVCSVTQFVSCTGDWAPLGTCTPNPCPPPPQVMLTVTIIGSGRGSVTTAPMGVDCPTTCAAPFALGTPVTLTPTPNLNSRFVGWSGTACTGPGACNFSINSATTVTAEFRCKADVNDSGDITPQDIFDFLNYWFTGDPRADVDGQPGIQPQDIFEFLNFWFTGCN